MTVTDANGCTEVATFTIEENSDIIVTGIETDVICNGEATGAIDHRIFAGKMDKGALSFGEKAIALAFRAPEGDFRNWTAIQRWAQEIARKLAAESGTAR